MLEAAYSVKNTGRLILNGTRTFEIALKKFDILAKFLKEYKCYLLNGILSDICKWLPFVPKWHWISHRALHTKLLVEWRSIFTTFRDITF